MGLFSRCASTGKSRAGQGQRHWWSRSSFLNPNLGLNLRNLNKSWYWHLLSSPSPPQFLNRNWKLRFDCNLNTNQLQRAAGNPCSALVWRLRNSLPKIMCWTQAERNESKWKRGSGSAVTGPLEVRKSAQIWATDHAGGRRERKKRGSLEDRSRTSGEEENRGGGRGRMGG